MKHINKFSNIFLLLWLISSVGLDVNGQIPQWDQIQSKPANWKYIGSQGFPVQYRDTTQYSTSVGISHIHRIYVDPANTDYILAGTHKGGLWRTTDGGDTWECLTDNDDLYGISGIIDIAVDPFDPSHICFISTFNNGEGHRIEMGLYESTDAGETWNYVFVPGYPTNNYSRKADLRRLVFDPYEQGIMYLVCYEKVYRFEYGIPILVVNEDFVPWNYGEDNIIRQNGFTDISIVQDQNENKVIYISGHILLKSDDNGNTFTEISQFEEVVYNYPAFTPTDDTIFQISRSLMTQNYEKHGDRIWILTEVTKRTRTFNPSKNEYEYEYFFNDNLLVEVNEIISDNPIISIINIVDNGDQCFNVEISPNNENIFYFGFSVHSVQRYTRSTQSLVDIATNSADPFVDSTWHHVDTRHLVVLDIDGEDMIYTGDDGGVTKSISNNGASMWGWENISDNGTCGLHAQEFFDIAGTDADPEYLIGGTQDNGTYFYDNGIWFQVAGSDGGICEIDNKEKEYAYNMNYTSLQRRYLSPTYNPQYIYKKQSYSKTVMELDPNNNNILYFGWDSLFRVDHCLYGDPLVTTNKIDIVNGNSLNQHIGAIALPKNKEGWIYYFRFGTFEQSDILENAMLISKDRGENWDDISHLLENTEIETNYRRPDYGAVDAACVNPNDPLEIFIGFSSYKDEHKKVFQVNFSDENFSSCTVKALDTDYPLNVPVKDLEYDDVYNRLYAGTFLGVYYYDFIDERWYEYGDCLPNSAVSGIEIHEGAQKIRASLLGYGIWEANLSYCPNSNDETRTGTASADEFVSAFNTIISDQNTNDYNIVYASNEITLNPGFIGDPGFRAVGSNKFSCNTGCDESCVSVFVPYSMIYEDDDPILPISKKSEPEEEVKVKGSKENSPTDMVTSIEDDYTEINDLSLIVYPNPSRGKIYLKINDELSDNAFVEVYDVHGSLVYSENLYNANSDIDLNSLQSGEYIIRLYNNNKLNITKIIIED